MSEPGLIVERLRVRYPGRREPALDEVSVQVAPTEIVGVAGMTGAGKSTLVLAAAGLVPRVIRASVDGSVTINGRDVLTSSATELAGAVGVVFSTPSLQLSASKPTVREELAFGLENLGVPRSEMDARIDATLGQLAISHLAEREPLALSGGEQQRVAIASILVMGTPLIALDEPAAQLDPAATRALANVLATLAADGRQVLVAEHSPEILARTERCLVLDAGRVVVEAPPGIALATESIGALGLHPPTLVALAEAAGVPAHARFDEAAISAALGELQAQAKDGRPTRQGADPVAGMSAPGSAPEVVVDGLVHRYPGGIEAVGGVTLHIRPAETVAVVGENGSGKTTLVKHFNGLLRPDAGRVMVGGQAIGRRPVSELARHVGFVFQNPDDQLFHGTVAREVGFGPRNLGVPAAEAAGLVEGALQLVGLADQALSNPYDLAFSHRKLVCLASVLAMEPSVIVLDEPTTGQDSDGLARIGAIVDTLSAAGRTVIAVTHDMEFAARHFGRVVVMRAGRVILDGPPADVFAGRHAELLASTGLVPPPAARIAAQLGLETVPPDAPSLLAALTSLHNTPA